MPQADQSWRGRRSRCVSTPRQLYGDLHHTRRGQRAGMASSN